MSPTDDSSLEELAELAIDACIAHLPVSQERLKEYQKAQTSDTICARVTKYCCSRWPSKKHIDRVLKPYWEVRGKLTIHNSNLLLYNNRLVIPASLQQELLEKIHQGHQGI